jgi:hypothetical protein
MPFSLFVLIVGCRKTPPLEAMFVGAIGLDKSKSGLFKPPSLDLIFHDCEIAVEFREATARRNSLPHVAPFEVAQQRERASAARLLTKPKSACCRHTSANAIIAKGRHV